MVLELTLSCGDYDRTRPLIDHSVKADGISFRAIPLPSPERHRRMLNDQEFDVCELSLASFFVAKERGMDLRALPVYPHRRFRHGYIFVNASSGIKSAADLIGKRVGVRRFQNTASVWVRGTLSDDYGVKRTDVQWFTEGDEELSVQFPSWLSCQRIPAGKNMDAMLLAGEMDCVIYPEALPGLAGSQIVRLFPDYKEVEAAYFARTGIFPPMHTVVIKGAILDRYPWVAGSVYRAFAQAKAACYAYCEDQRKSSLAWFGHAWDEQKRLLGADPWPYTLEGNRRALETLRRYLLEDGLITSSPDLDALFPPIAP
jgi:4,5-dihydroxyphthalate decarboxylase